MIDIRLILRAKMERKELQNFKQQIQIITCNDHNPHSSELMEWEQSKEWEKE